MAISGSIDGGRTVMQGGLTQVNSLTDNRGNVYIRDVSTGNIYFGGRTPVPGQTIWFDTTRPPNSDGVPDESSILRTCIYDGEEIITDTFERDWEQRLFWADALNAAAKNDMARLNDHERVAEMQAAVDDLNKAAIGMLTAPLAVIGAAEVGVAAGGYMCTVEAGITATEAQVTRRVTRALVRRVARELKNSSRNEDSSSGLDLFDDLMSSATQPWGIQGLTQAGRALQKHAGRSGSVFGEIKFSHKTANQDALDIINKIRNSPNQVILPAENGGSMIFDKSTGMGIGVSRNGNFNGFRELGK
jgi:hypothetical protein